MYGGAGLLFKLNAIRPRNLELETCFQILVPGSCFMVPGSWFQVSESRFLVPGTCISIPSSRFPDSRFMGSWLQVSCFCFLVLGSWF